MTSRLNPYLNFNGNVRRALEFYTGVFGGNLTLSTFADFGAAGSPDADQIMHGQLETPAGYTIMAADVTSEMPYQPPAGFSVSLSGDDGDALHEYWEKLCAGGTVTMAMQKQVWGDEFGMCVDQFGVSWLVNIGQPQSWPGSRSSRRSRPRRPAGETPSPAGPGAPRGRNPGTRRPAR